MSWWDEAQKKVDAEYTKEELDRITDNVHCDMYVIHAPGECEYCDKSSAQQYRALLNVNYTGEKNPDKRPCPAELMRGDMCQVWGGNKPVPADMSDEDRSRQYWSSWGS